MRKSGYRGEQVKQANPKASGSPVVLAPGRRSTLFAHKPPFNGKEVTLFLFLAS